MCMNIILPNPKLCRRHGIWDCGEHGARQATSITGLATSNAGSAWFDPTVRHEPKQGNMKITITTEDSVQILAALYEKARRTEEDTGEVPRKLMLTAKKVRRQIRENLNRRRHDKDKRRGKAGDKRTPCGDKTVADGKPAAVKPYGGQADTGEQHTECKA